MTVVVYILSNSLKLIILYNIYYILYNMPTVTMGIEFTYENNKNRDIINIYINKLRRDIRKLFKESIYLHDCFFTLIKVYVLEDEGKYKSGNVKIIIGIKFHCYIEFIIENNLIQLQDEIYIRVNEIYNGPFLYLSDTYRVDIDYSFLEIDKRYLFI